jgi:sorting nexin-27
MSQDVVVEFSWSEILAYESDDESMSFDFEYVREGKKPRWVKIYTPYVSETAR